ncbi:MAG: restriction endonuclease subunit S [Selenomonas sp.]|nr:restriction endonuclease subunit S [Selenomonas sp.]
MTEWKEYYLDEICLNIIDCVNKTAPLSDSPTEYKMLRTSDIRNGNINLEGLNTVTQDTYEKWSRRGKLQVGDIVFTREAPLGEVGLVRQADNIFLGQRLVLFRADPNKCDNLFLLYALMFHDNKQAIITKGVGSTVLHLRVPECGKIKIKAPELHIQKQIGQILSRYDDLIANHQQQIKLLEEAAQRLYKEWFVDLRFPGCEKAEIVDGVPKGWKRTYLGKLIDVMYGKDHKKVPEEGNIPVYGSGGIMRKCNKALYEGESVLIPRKGSLNNIMYVNEAFWTVDTMFYAAMKDKWLAKWVYFYLRQFDMYSMNIGAAVPSMTVKILDAMDVLLPTVELLQKYDEVASNYFSQIKVLQKKCELMQEARDRLLPKLISGEIEVSS